MQSPANSIGKGSKINDRFLKACWGEPVDRTPVWFMRQAGRYLADYQAIRNTTDFLTLCKTPELAAEVAMQPVDILGVDAAILFSDILIPVEAMGMELEFLEKRGPVLAAPVRDREAVDSLIVPDTKESMPFVLETIRILRRELEGRVPLIGFSGAPYTLATYMTEGGSSRNFQKTKGMMYNDPELFEQLLEKITDTVINYLSAQIDAGAQAVQIFDSWAGNLSPYDYENHVFPHVTRVIRALEKHSAPVIYFVNDCPGILKIAARSGADVISVDWRVDMESAVDTLGSDVSIQGNMDPVALFGPRLQIEKRVQDILWKSTPARGHIFNLGHGILPQTPVENVIAAVEAVHKSSEEVRFLRQKPNWPARNMFGT